MPVARNLRFEMPVDCKPQPIATLKLNLKEKTLIQIGMKFKSDESYSNEGKTTSYFTKLIQNIYILVY